MVLALIFVIVLVHNRLFFRDQGLFGNTAASQAGGLFGNTANTSTATAFGTGTGLFGQPNAGFGNVGTQVTGGKTFNNLSFQSLFLLFTLIV